MDECCIGGYCHENATCTNTPGSYICKCMEGYSENSTLCEGKNRDNSENQRESIFYQLIEQINYWAGNREDTSAAFKCDEVEYMTSIVA